MCGKEPIRNPSSRRARCLAAALLLVAAAAPQGPAEAGDGLWDRALETLNLKSAPAGPAPDFVERTRPDPGGLGYIPPALPHKVSQRPVKSPDDIKAATAALDAARTRQLSPGGPPPVELAKGRKGPKPKSSAVVAD